MRFNNHLYINLKSLAKLMLLLGVFIVSSQTWAQTKVLADEVSYTSGDDKMTSLAGCGPLLLSPCFDPTVQNANNSLVDDNNYARLLASPGLLAGLGSYKGEIELKFAQTLSADTWSYVRMEGDSELFRALLGGSLGDLLGGVLGYVLFGNQEVVIDARMGSTSILSRSSTQGFGTDRVKLIQDGDGNNYLAIRPASDYDRVRITNEAGSAILLGIEKELDIYNAFYYENDGEDCGRPFATSFDGGGGIGLEVGDLNDQNLGNAIDNDENSFSRLKSSSVLDINIASTLSQHFYFPTTSAETTTANIKLALGSGGLVNTDLLGAVEIIFFEDNTIVSRRSLQSSLLNNTNALALLDNGDPVTLTFAPGKAFDRIVIKLNSPVGVNLLGNGVKIYDVQRFDGIGTCINPEIAEAPTATQDPFETSSCATDLIDFENVDFPHNAVDGNNETYTTLYADTGSLLISGPTAGYIEMDLGQNVPANKTTYVRINYDEDVLDRLVGGSLGKLVGDLANDLLLGNQYFEVEAKNGANPVLTRSSSDAFEGTSNGAVTLVQDDIGRYYIAITPDAAYNRVRITNHVVALLATGKKASLDVYNACFEIGTDVCLAPNFTSYRGGGAGLNVGNISNVGVTNAYRAISENSSDYSEINLGVAGLFAHVYQTIYFSQPSQPNDKVKVRMAIEPSSALSLDVLGRYKVKFFNGATQVGNDETLQSGLINNLDLVTLFNSGGIVELEYEPNGIFDRVEIGAESIASVNVATEPLRLYSVERYGDTCPLTKTPFPFEAPSCSATLIASKNADDVQNLFDDDFDSYATLKSGAGFLLGLGNKYEGYVEMGYDQPVAAGVTSYIRIDFEETILEGLVGGSLGNVVSGLLDGLVLGDHFFIVEVKDENGVGINSASSNQASAGGDDAIRVVQDAAGRYYIAVTPTSDYQSVRITDATDSALGFLAQPHTMNVYGMCTDLVEDSCFGPFATSYDYEGLNLSVNDLGGAGVTNGSYAINENSTNYSEISNGNLAVGASTKQWIFFNSTSTTSDSATIKFKTQGGGVDLNVLGGLEIKAYLGNDEVAEFDFQNGIINGVNIIDLLNNNQMVELDFAPGFEFDRISVGIRTLVGVSVFPPIHLYEVDRECDNDQTVPMPDPIYGCNENTYINSDDPNTIEYDNMVSIFHSSIIKEVNGDVKAWGWRAAPNGSSNNLSPVIINSDNGYDYDGEILKSTAGGLRISHAQFVVLTTQGLYTWGTQGTIFSSSLTSGTAFQKVAATETANESGTNTYSLPKDVEPLDVKMMFGSHHTLAIVTHSGEAWMLSLSSGKYGDGDTSTNADSKWHRIHKSSTSDGATENGTLDNVVTMRGNRYAMMALTTNGNVYTWGENSYLGDNTPATDRTYATQMILPAGTPKLIGMTGSANNVANNTTGNTHYLLMTNGDLYAMGNNDRRQLGDYTTTERQSWIRVKGADSNTDLPPIAWISPNEHDGKLTGAINALTPDGKLWSWGSNDGLMLGGASQTDLMDPTLMGRGLDEGDRLTAVETGGHTTMVVKQCSKKYGYIGHKTDGSMGDGSSGSSNEKTFNFSNTADINLCGAPTAPDVQDFKFCLGDTIPDINLADALLGEIPNYYDLEWWTTDDRTPGTEVADPTAVGAGDYYAFLIPQNDGNCDNPASSHVYIGYEDIELLLEKSSEFMDDNGNGIADVGETITYTFTITNNGAEKVNDLVLNDATIDISDMEITPESIAPGEEITFEVEYEITSDNIEDEGVYNLATIAGKSDLDCPIEQTSVDPNPLEPGDPGYDPTKPDHTYTPLKGRSLLITNPNIYQRVKNN